MKKLLLTFLAVVMVAILSSCGNKCTTCTFHWDEGAVGKTLAQPEVCGSKQDITDYKGGLQAAVDALALTVSGTNATYTCVDE